MRIFAKELENKTIHVEKLLAYGFQKHKKIYEYKQPLSNQTFEVHVQYDGTNLTSWIIDLESQEEYTLVDIQNAQGSFLGVICEEYEACLKDIFDTCIESSIFQKKQTKQIIEYVKNNYQETPEYLWDSFPTTAVFRHKEDKKWYALLTIIKENKLGLKGEEEIEIMNVKASSETIEQLIDEQHYFRGYHMNKKHWLTIKLDGKIPIQKIYTLLEESYNMSKRS